MSDPASYTVGWICAVLTEYVAAQEILDEEHQTPASQPSNDSNKYTLGKIGEHNVVIAVLPHGEYGTVSAASVATNMMNSFPNVRIVLMVGIGGGVPSGDHEIRLGDVVVGATRDGQGGVFQYDFGKSIQNQDFEHTGFLNQPPTILRTAIMGIQAKYMRRGHQLEQAVNEVIDRSPRLHRLYKRPELGTDMLFKAEVVHDARGCAQFCAENPSNLVPRRERTEDEDNPAIHYGLIASGNLLMKDALIRDRLAKEKNVLCFEMEAAGLMNNFPCLIIRGICDYSDSHKSKEWQGYAAMIAAAYAKDLLNEITPNKIAAEKSIGVMQSGFQDLKSIAQKQLHMQESVFQQKLSYTRQECLRLFRLTSGTKEITYEWYKDRVQTRINGTCEWFLSHPNFRNWLKRDSGPLLVSADPGCGKSVLAKYLIDEALPRSATICYFFFKDQDQNTARQALCAALHQLFSQNLSLIKHAMDEFEKDGKGLINSTTSLWTILEKAVRDPEAGPIIIVLDALDECAESELGRLIHNIKSQFVSNHSSQGSLKYLLTARPYEQIVYNFRSLLKSIPSIHIPGEEESESISREVNHVIQYRVEELAEHKKLSDVVKSHLARRLLEVPHRTYLWVYLVFDYLETQHFKKTPKGIDSTIEILPKDVYEAYEQMLDKSKGNPMALKALSIILAAIRPLTVSEMNAALNVDGRCKSIDDLDLEEDEDFKSSLRNSCGLFVSIYHDKIHFLHQTAREFLLTQTISPETVPIKPCWRHSIASQYAHYVLAEICVFYLGFLNNDPSPTDKAREILQYLDRYTFLEYSAQNWGTHYREACISAGNDIIPSALDICSENSRSWAAWFPIYWRTQSRNFPKNFTGLMISSYLGLETIITEILGKSVDYEGKDKLDRAPLFLGTPLFLAAENEHRDTVRLLLEKNADYELKNKQGRTPLSLAAENGHQSIIQLLLEKGADYSSGDELYNRTPLSFAAGNGHENTVRLFLEKGADYESKDVLYGRTPMSFAAGNGHGNTVRLLLEKGADYESKDELYGRTPLFFAAANGHGNNVKLLLDKGADCNLRDKQGQTPLFFAAGTGHEGMVQLLLKKGADYDLTNKYGQTPLFLAAETGHEKTVELLLEKGAAHDLQDAKKRTPLSYAAENGHVGKAKLLLERGAYYELKDTNKRTPLSYATENGHESTVNLLLEKRACYESKDIQDRTPLYYAASNGHRDIVELLLEKGADVESKDKDGTTPLLIAITSKHHSTVQLLLEKGADIDTKDKDGATPLSIAIQSDQRSTVMLLLEKGAELELESKEGHTALLWAEEDRNMTILERLQGACSVEGERWPRGT